MVDPVRHTPPPQPEPEPVPPPPAAPPGTEQNPIQLALKPREPQPGEMGPHAPSATPELDGTPDIPLPDTPGLAATADPPPREPSLLDFALGDSPAQTPAPANDPFSLPNQPPPTRAEVSEVQLERVEDATLAVPGSVPATAGAPTQPAAIDPAVQAELNAAVAAELAVSTNAELYVERGGFSGGTYTYTSTGPQRSHADTDALVAQRGESLVQAYGRSDPAVQTALREAIDSYRAQRWVQDAATAAGAIPPPQEPRAGEPAQPQADAVRARAFAEDLANIPPELQARIPAAVNGLDASRGLLERATAVSIPASASNADIQQAAINLETVATALPGTLRDELVRNVTGLTADALTNDPAGSVEAAQTYVDVVTSRGLDDVASALTPELAGRIVDGPLQLREGGISPLMREVEDFVSRGGNPAFAIGLANTAQARGDEEGARLMLQAVQTGIRWFVNKPPTAAIEDNARAMSMIAQDTANGTAANTAEYIKAFYDHNGDARAARDEIAAYGANLADAIAAFDALAPGLQRLVPTIGGQFGSMPGFNASDFVAEIYGTPLSNEGMPFSVGDAIQIATDHDPSLLAGDRGAALIRQTAEAADHLGIDSAKLGDQVREVAARLTERYANNLFASIINDAQAGVNTSSVSDMDLARSRINAGLNALPDSMLTRLGFPDRAAIQPAIDAVFNNMPADGAAQVDVADSLRRVEDGLATLPGDVDINNSPIGRSLRFLGAGLGITALVGSGSDQLQDPSVTGLLSVVGDTAGGMKAVADALRVASPTLDANPLLRGLGGRVMGAASAVGDIGNAVNEFNKGDNVRGGLYLMGALGTAMMGVSGSLLAAGIGAPLVVGAVVLGAQYDHVQQSNEFAYQGDDQPGTMPALDALGFDRDAAIALSDHSSQGLSAVPLLVRYASERGLDAQQAMDWINGIDATRVDGAPSKLDLLRDNLHHTLDEIDGDLARLPSTDSPADAEFLAMESIDAEGADAEGVVVVTSEDLILDGDRAPMSMRQIDDVLQVLGIAPPPLQPQPG
jgi:hypothetical protein